MQMLGFLETLCGPKAVELKVKDMDKYSFDPKKLVMQIASILVRVWRLEKAQHLPNTFLSAIVNFPEYSSPTMGKCVSILHKQNVGDADLPAAFTALVQMV